MGEISDHIIEKMQDGKYHSSYEKEQEMNFQEARNLEGQKNAKGYQQGVSMTGQILTLIDSARIFTTNQKPTQRITLCDNQGETQRVKVFLGNGPDILLADIGTTQSFTDLVMNRYKGNISYMAFWDNMHPPQGLSPTPEITPTQLNAATQAIIDRHRKPTAGQQGMDHMGGAQSVDASGGSYPTPQPPIPTQQDYQAKERKKVVGMCFTNLLAARLTNTLAIEVFADKEELSALWQLANICVDGTAQVDKETSF